MPCAVAAHRAHQAAQSPIHLLQTASPHPSRPCSRNPEPNRPQSTSALRRAALHVQATQLFAAPIAQEDLRCSLSQPEVGSPAVTGVEREELGAKNRREIQKRRKVRAVLFSSLFSRTITIQNYYKPSLYISRPPQSQYGPIQPTNYISKL